ARVGAVHGARVPLFRGAQRELCALALGDVGERAGEQRRLAGRSAKDLAARVHPAYLARRVEHAVLDVEAAFAALQARLDAVVDALPVLRVEAAVRLEVCARPDFHALGNAEQMTRARR